MTLASLFHASNLEPLADCALSVPPTQVAQIRSNGSRLEIAVALYARCILAAKTRLELQSAVLILILSLYIISLIPVLGDADLSW